MFQRTTAINKLLGLKKTYKIVQGGTWAGKTYGIDSILINKSIINKNIKTTITAESIPAIKQGALKDFKEIMHQTNRWNQDNYNGTDRIYTFSSGSSIEFASFDSIGKAQASGKRNILFLNEAYYIPFEVADALMGRTSDEIWIDFNPHAEFWGHTEINVRDDADFIILLPGDNEAIPDKIKKDHEEARKKAKTSEWWANWVRVFLDGQIGRLQGVVFDNWQEIDFYPKSLDWEVYGIDFGFTNDPTTIIKVGYKERNLYIDEILYRTGMTNQEIAKFIKSRELKGTFIADSAEPKSIEEIYRWGIDIRGAEKGKDSIIFGLNMLQNYNLFVTKSSVNMIKEFRNYMWDKDKEGKTLNKPIDMYNHCIDPLRYVSMYKLKKRKEYAII
jgi:phage terminase large subunit